MLSSWKNNEDNNGGENFLDGGVGRLQPTIGKMRSKCHVTQAAMLVMDLDGLSNRDFEESLKRIEADRISYLVYSTFSHGDPEKPGVRGRLIMPMDRELNCDEYAAAWLAFDQQYLNGHAQKADSSGKNLYQQQGTWCCHPNRQEQAFSKKIDAGVISADASLALSQPNEKTGSIKTSSHSQEKQNHYPPSDADRVAEQCNQIEMFRKNKGIGQSEPLWFACLGVVGHCQNGAEKSHEWSCAYEGYHFEETEKKLEHRLKTPPTTCAHFREKHSEGCANCSQTCHSPISLGIQTASESHSRSTQKSEDGAFSEVPPCLDSVDPKALFDEISRTIRRFIILTPEQADAVTLWIVMTWFVDCVQVLPLLIINAPEKACGKSQLLDVIGRLCRKPLVASNLTPAVLFRVISISNPTLLIDEADTFIGGKGELQGLINAGHTRSSAYVWRVVGDNHEPKQFSVWGAKAFAGIALDKHFGEATMSRGIVINMHRKTNDEKVERLRHADAGLFDELTPKLARISLDYDSQVNQARPELPEALNDRQQDNWEPLMAIAGCGGNNWQDRALAAALKLSKTDDAPISESNVLLADIREIFLAKGVEKIKTVDLIEALSEDEEKPWNSYDRGNDISSRQLGALLKPYGIKSRSLKFDGRTLKGYSHEDFTDVFARYLPPSETHPENLPEPRYGHPEPLETVGCGVSENPELKGEPHPQPVNGVLVDIDF